MHKFVVSQVKSIYLDEVGRSHALVSLSFFPVLRFSPSSVPNECERWGIVALEVVRGIGWDAQQNAGGRA